MTEIDIETEQRKSKRYLAHEGSLVETNTYYIIVGQILDIGSSGMSFTYVDIDSGIDLNGNFELRIWINNKLFIDKIKCRTMSDFALDERPYSEVLKKRRRGVQFIDLKQYQKSKIEAFIQNNTINDEKDET